MNPVIFWLLMGGANCLLWLGQLLGSFYHWNPSAKYIHEFVQRLDALEGIPPKPWKSPGPHHSWLGSAFMSLIALFYICWMVGLAIAHGADPYMFEAPYPQIAIVAFTLSALWLAYSIYRFFWRRMRYQEIKQQGLV